MKESKTRIVHIDKGFDFLGYNLRTYIRPGPNPTNRKILLITPSKKNIKRVKININQVLKDNKNNSLAVVISKLNPILRGWANYYNSVVSSKTFKQIGSFCWNAIRVWLKIKYPKSNFKILNKKFEKIVKGNRHVFFDRDEKGVEWQLFQIGIVKVKRHSIGKISRNIFLLNEAELEKILKKAIPGLSEWNRKLWNKQKGLCPVCDIHLIEEPILEVHHILPRKLGGKTKLSNLILLHKHCHYMVTHCKDERKLRLLIKKGILKDK